MQQCLGCGFAQGMPAAINQHTFTAATNWNELAWNTATGDNVTNSWVQALHTKKDPMHPIRTQQMGCREIQRGRESVLLTGLTNHARPIQSSVKSRGRDAGCPAPPARIRT